MVQTALDEGSIDERLYVASVAKAMCVLEIFEKKGRGLSLTEITDLTGLGRSSTQRFVYTLYSLGYLRRDPITKLYAISAKVFGFVHGMIGANAALERSYPILSQLAKDTRETASWVELHDDQIVVIGTVPSVHLASVRLSVGNRFAGLPSSSGQVLVCQRSRDEIKALYERLDAESRHRFGNCSLSDIMDVLSKVKDAGYALTEKSVDEDSISISAPVFDFNGNRIAAINLSALASRYETESARADLIPKVIAAAQAASSS